MFLLVLDELQLSATDSALYLNPLFQISTKNAADPIANVGTSQDEYCGWASIHQCDIHKSVSKSTVLTIHCLLYTSDAADE